MAGRRRGKAGDSDGPAQLELGAVRVPSPELSAKAVAPPELAAAQSEVVAAPAEPVEAPAEPHIYTVSELVQRISRQLEREYPQVWVEGEVSNLRVPSSGHAYFTLKDAGAQLSVTMFRSAISRLRFKLEDGQSLRLRGRLSIYEAQGKFQLLADLAEPCGLGALQLAFEQLKRRLEAEGLFEARHKKPLPLLPRTIAVVTSPTGAALQDILRVLHTRCPVRVVVCPTAVQGVEAPAELVAALGRADALGADLIICGRGGGSLEDLWAFNTEEVARAIFALRTPCISAVGHEVDVTISDWVADLRAPTPSAAAEMAVPVLAELEAQLEVLGVRLGRALRQRLTDANFALERALRRLGTPAQRLNRERQLVDEIAGRLETLLARRLARQKGELGGLRLRLEAQQPRVRLARDRATLVEVAARLEAAAERALDPRRRRLEQLVAALELVGRRLLEPRRRRLGQLAASLDALSPLAVLGRGYSVVQDARGGVVREAGSLAVGEALSVRLHRGRLGCTVTEVEGDPSG